MMKNPPPKAMESYFVLPDQKSSHKQAAINKDALKILFPNIFESIKQEGSTNMLDFLNQAFG
jgi:hypothetical protein